MRWHENSSEEVLDNIYANELSPLNVAIKAKSLACVKYLVESSTAQRELYQEGEWLQGQYNNLSLALIAKVKDLEVLNYLSKQNAFVLTSTDVQSFLQAAIQDKWI